MPHDDLDPPLAELRHLAGLEGDLEMLYSEGRSRLLAGIKVKLHDRHVRVLTVVVLTVLPLVAAERVLPHERGVANVTVERLLGIQLGHLPAALPAGVLPLGGLGLEHVRVELLHMFAQVTGLLGVEAAVVALERALSAMNALVHTQRSLAGTGVAAFWALFWVLRLV